jgi:HEAT repeat protein
LLHLLGTQDHEVVVDAAKILASSGSSETIKPMIMVAADWERRGTLDNPVLYELYRYGQDSVTLLTDALAAGEEELRAAAATCIGALGDARAYPALHAALSDPSELVRSAANTAMARLQREQT